MNTLLRDSWVPALLTHVKGWYNLRFLNSLAFKSTAGCRYGLPQCSKSDTTLIVSLHAFAWPVTTHGSLHLVRRARQRISFDLWLYVLCYVYTYVRRWRPHNFTTPISITKDYHAPYRPYAHIIVPRRAHHERLPRPVRPHNFTTPIMKDYHAPYAHIISPRSSWKITTPRTCIPHWSSSVLLCYSTSNYW